MDNDLFSKFLSGQASEEEIARLRADLSRDPSSVDALFEAAELERDLGEVLRPARRRSWRLPALAASVLVAAAVAFFVLKEAPREVARVDAVQGRLLRAGSPMSAGDAVFPDDAVETDAKSRAVLRYDDGSKVELGSASRAAEFASAGGKRIRLERGSLTGDVRPQPAEHPLIVRTPEGEARVLGTRFTLSVGGGASRLDVEKGLVRLTRRVDGRSVDVAAGQMAVASAGAAPVARPSVAAMKPGTWLALPETRMEAVTPDPTRFASTRGVSGPPAVIGAWSGGAFDTRRGRLILWGGGYSDYAGNELYAFALDSMSWQRLTDPTAPPRLNEEENADGTPTSRATYNGLAYLAQADRLFSVGGARAGNGFGCSTPWTFDFETNRWTRRASLGGAPRGGLGGTCSYDPATHKVWWGDGSGTYSLDVESDRWTKHNDDEFYYHTGAIDTKRGLWVAIGNGKVFAVDVRGGAPVRQVWKTTGGDALVSKSNPGVDYDPVRDRIVAWAGGPVYSLNPEMKTWTVTEAPGAPPATPNGIFGRWRYVPALDAFIVVTAIDQNVQFFKPLR
jgi:ferric-dicitrate binding protein FerR (iron transport regulator)